MQRKNKQSTKPFSLNTGRPPTASSPQAICFGEVLKTGVQRVSGTGDQECKKHSAQAMIDEGFNLVSGMFRTNYLMLVDLAEHGILQERTAEQTGTKSISQSIRT